MRKVITAWLGSALVACACATSQKMNALSIGMTKAEVVKVMGRPTSTSAIGDVEYLTYRLSETSDDAFYGITTDYFVRLVNGRVDAYGRRGDFDSTKAPAVEIKKDVTVRQE